MVEFKNEYMNKLWDKLGDKFLQDYYEHRYQDVYDNNCEMLVENMNAYLKEKGLYGNINKVLYDNEYRNTIYIEGEVECVFFNIDNNRDVSQRVSYIIDVDGDCGIRYEDSCDLDGIDKDEIIDKLVEEFLGDDTDVPNEIKLMERIELERVIDRINLILSEVKDMCYEYSRNIDDIDEESIKCEFEYYIENYIEYSINYIQSLKENNKEIIELITNYYDSEKKKETYQISLNNFNK